MRYRAAAVLIVLALATGLRAAEPTVDVEPNGAAAEGETAPAVSDPAQALYQQGLALERADQFEAAGLKYQAALQVAPGYPQALREMGRCDLKLGWKDQALVQLQAFQAGGGDDDQVDAMVDYLKVQGQRLGALPLANSGSFGLALELGYAWGFTNAGFGHNFNENGNADLLTYTYNPGEGLSIGVEALVRVSPSLSVGLVALPLSTNVSAHETLVEGVTGGITTTADSTQLSHFALPLMARVHTSASVGKAVRVSSFAGAGVILTQPYVETSTYKTSDSTGNYITTARYQRDLQDGMAFQAGLGAQMQLSPHCLLYLSGSLLLAHLPATAATYHSTTVDSAGKVVATSEDSASYVSSPPPPVTGTTPSTTVINPGPGRTTVISYDDGAEQYTLTKQFTAGNQTSQDFTETQLLSSTVGADDVNFKMLALSAGLRWEF